MLRFSTVPSSWPTGGVGIPRPVQVSITALVNDLPRAPAALPARREELARLGQILSAGENVAGTQVLRGLGGAAKSELAQQVSCGTTAFPPARRTGRLLLPSGAGYRFTHPSARGQGIPGQGSDSWTKTARRPSRTGQTKARIPQSKGAQNAQIGAIRTLIDIEHARKQIGGSRSRWR